MKTKFMDKINRFNSTHETKQILNWNIFLSVVFSIGTVFIALKFITTIIQCNLMGVQRYVYFPIFPNVLDSTFLSLGAIYFLWGKIKDIRKLN